MKKKYKAIISDIDGTLITSHTYALPSQKVKKAIQKATKKGITFSLASARPYSMLTYLIKELSLQSPIILNNGAEIYDTKSNKPIWESTIPSEVAENILTMIKKYQKNYHVDLSREELANPKSLRRGEKVFKFVIFDLHEEEADKLIKDVQEKFKTVNCIKGGSYIGSDLMAVFISNGDATKQHAVIKFAKILSIEPSEIIAIGDHYNDFSLLMACGLKVAMENAVPELKAIADYIAPTVEEDGVADIIEKFIL